MAGSNNLCVPPIINAAESRSNRTEYRGADVQRLIVSPVVHCLMDNSSNKIGNVNMTGRTPEGLRRGTLSAVAHPPGDERQRTWRRATGCDAGPACGRAPGGLSVGNPVGFPRRNTLVAGPCKKVVEIAVLGVDKQLNVEYIINMGRGFGDLLRSRRREAGISQRRLAEEVGVDFSYVSKLENDRIPSPAGDTVVRIAKVIGCDPGELLAAARKMPSRVEEALVRAPEAQRFLQAASAMKLSRAEWEELIGKLESLREPE